MKVLYIRSQREAEQIQTFFFKPPSKVRQIAGQFTELTISHENMDNRGDKRWFTLSNSPDDELLSITTRLSLQGSSFKRELQNLTPGTELHMASPMGDFVLPKDTSIPLFFIAGGIGATPYHSIIKYLQDIDEVRDISVLYAASDVNQVVFRSVLDRLGIKFEILIDSKLTAQEILKRASKPEMHIYLSGPEPMVETLDRDLKKSGYDNKLLHTDFFSGYTAI